MYARLLEYFAARPNLVRLVLLPAGIALLLGLLSLTPQWESLELKGFDVLTRFTASGKPHVPVVIVAIDEASFSEINEQWPWPRGLHAKLVDALREAGAAVIAFDIMFAEPDRSKQDPDFAEAIARAGNVVLGANVSHSENDKL